MSLLWRKAMKLINKRRPVAAVVGVAVASLVLAACGGSGDAASSNGKVKLSFLVDNSETSVSMGKGLADAFHAKNPNITIDVEQRPQGGDGDNVVKTRLSTGDMNDVFMYNSGSLFSALNPEKTLVPLSDQGWAGNVEDAFATSVTAGKKIYGAPFGTFMGGGIMYNIPAYKQLGLQVPKTWDEFMANNARIKAAGKTPVIQTY